MENYRPIDVTSWCSRCRDDGCMGRFQFYLEFTEQGLPQKVAVFYEKRCGRFPASYAKLPDSLCDRCHKKLNERIEKFQASGLSIELVDVEETDSEAEYMDDFSKELYAAHSEEIEHEKKATLLSDRAQDAWKKGHLEEGDRLAIQAEDLRRSPYAKGDPRVEEGIRAYRKAGCIKSPNNFELALALLNEALEKNSYYYTYQPYWDRRGDVLHKLGRRKEAIAAYKKRIEMIEMSGGQTGKQWSKVAEFLWELGQYNEAREIMSDPRKVPSDWYKPLRRKMGIL